MILFWVTLLVLHRGYTLVPVTTVLLGEPATFTCALPNIEIARIEIHWYKQSTRETLQLMVTLRKSAELENEPEYAPQFSESRLAVNNDDNFSNLTILKTIQEDEGLYHCEITDRWSNPEWSGTYLLLKGNTQRTSNCTSTGGTISFGDGTKVEIERTARYEFIALVIATVCLVISVIANIVFICCRTSRPVGSQFKGLNIWDLQKANAVLILSCAALAISLIVIAFLIYTIKMKTCDCCNAAVALQTNAATASGHHQSQQRDEYSTAYYAPTLTKRKTGRAERRNVKAAEGDDLH